MKISTMAAAAALMMLSAGMASAQGQGGGQGNPAMRAAREACAADMQKVCPDKTGPDRRQCMADNQDKISDGCKKAMADARAAMQSGGAAPPPPKPN
jgi:hypothetical protein